MRNLLSTTAVALTLAFSAGALAQQTPPANSSTGPNSSASVRANDETQYKDFAAFLEKYGSADFTTASSSLEGTSTYSVVALSALQGADMTKLQTAITQHQQDLTALRAKVAATQEAVASLSDEGLTPENVVWAEKGKNNTILLFVTDKASK